MARLKGLKIDDTGSIVPPSGTDANRPTNTVVKTSFKTVGTTSWTAPANVTSVEVLVVAGGGGGGANHAGGGGAGGVIYRSGYPVTPGQSYTVTVGAGGSRATSFPGQGSNGGNSVFDRLIAIGGGGGGCRRDTGTAGLENGRDGGSGGGGGGQGTDDTPTSPGGKGTPGQGNDGGIASYHAGAGGGGAVNEGETTYNSIGGSSSTVRPGDGGDGAYFPQFASEGGSPAGWFGGGGGGGGYIANVAPIGRGGAGGGGKGQVGGSDAGVNGVANTGGGGGGANGGGNTNGGNGGSGIVILSYSITSDGDENSGAIRYNTESGSLENFSNTSTWKSKKIKEKNAVNYIDNGLIMHLDAEDYDGGGIWYDRSGSGNHVTLYNSPTVSNGVIKFNGTDQYGRTASTLDLTPYDAVTVEVLFRLPDGNVNGPMVFEHSADWNSNSGGFGLYANSGGGALIQNSFHTNHNTFGAPDYYHETLSERWLHHVNTFRTVADAEGRLAYCDGERVRFWDNPSTQTLDSSVFRNDFMFFGGRNGAPNNKLELKEFRIYGRKLRDHEVKKNYDYATRNLDRSKLAVQSEAGPNIVEENLLCYLDAANKNSYPGNDDIWWDLRGGYNFRIYNNGGWTPENGGAVIFNGSSSYAQSLRLQETNLSNISVNIWFYPTSWSNYENPIDCNYGYNGTTGNIGPRLELNASGAGWITSGDTGNNGSTGYCQVSYSNQGNNRWYNSCFTYDGKRANGYWNGQLRNRDVNQPYYWVNLFQNIWLGRGFHLGGAERWFSGRIAVVQIYDRKLESHEVMQNFNAFRNRYGQ